MVNVVDVRTLDLTQEGIGFLFGTKEPKEFVSL